MQNKGAESGFTNQFSTPFEFRCTMRVFSVAYAQALLRLNTVQRMFVRYLDDLYLYQSASERYEEYLKAIVDNHTY